MKNRAEKMLAVALLMLGGFLAPGCTPPDDTFTILLYMFRDPTHISSAKDWKQKAEKHTGWKGLFVVHKADHSRLYWGKYRTIDDAQPDLKKSKAYRTDKGIRPFAMSVIAVLPGKDVGRPEWDLTKAEGTYTVLIAVFYNVPKAGYVGRKRFSAQYCEQLRKQGEEAYYKHDAGQSIVTVGSFPDSAIEMVEADGQRGAVVRDDRIHAIKKRHEFLAVNGRKEFLKGVNPDTKEPFREARKSYVIRIPKEEQAGGAGSFDGFGQQQPR